MVQACLREILARERRGNTENSKWEKERKESKIENGTPGEGRV